MSEIAQITFTEWKKLTAKQIRELKSVEILADGSYLFTAIIPPTSGGAAITDNIRINADYLGFKGNTVGGKTIEEVNKIKESSGG